jgi:hypothetical protein
MEIGALTETKIGQVANRKIPQMAFSQIWRVRRWSSS